MKGFRFVEGESYIGLFFVVLGLLAAVGVVCHFAFGNGDYAVVVFPLFGMFILIVQQSSGVALGRSWRATWPRGTRQYELAMAALVIWTLFTGWMAYDAFR